MELQTQILIYLGIYFLFLLGLSFYYSKKQKKEDYLISSRNRTWFSIGMSKYATSVGSTYFIVYVGYLYQFGIGVFSFVFGWILAMVILAYYISPKIYKISKEKKFLKLSEIVNLKLKYNVVNKIVDFISSSILFFWLVVMLIGGANLISHFNILSYELSIISILFIVIIYLYLVGYKGVISTDVIQTSFIIIILGILGFTIFNETSLIQLQTLSFKELPLLTVVGFLLVGCLGTFSYIDRYQLIYSSKNKENIQKGFLFAIPLILISFVLLSILSYFMRLQSLTFDPSFVFIFLIENFISENLLGIVFVMFFASIMSSIDSYIYGITSQFTFFKKKTKIENIKFNLIFLVLAVFIFSYFIRDILNLTIFAACLSLILSFPMIYLFFGDFEKSKKSVSRFLFSLFSSILGLIIGFVFIGFKPTVVLIIIIFGLLGLVFKSKKIDKFFLKYKN